MTSGPILWRAHLKASRDQRGMKSTGAAQIRQNQRGNGRRARRSPHFSAVTGSPSTQQVRRRGLGLKMKTRWTFVPLKSNVWLAPAARMARDMSDKEILKMELDQLKKEVNTPRTAVSGPGCLRPRSRPAWPDFASACFSTTDGCKLCRNHRFRGGAATQRSSDQRRSGRQEPVQGRQGRLRGHIAETRPGKHTRLFMGGIYTLPVEFPARKCTIVAFPNPSKPLWIWNNHIKIAVWSFDLNCVLWLFLEINMVMLSGRRHHGFMQDLPAWRPSKYGDRAAAGEPSRAKSEESCRTA